ncbi:hypothetical protein H1P_2910003 [Hyella patelloides LEGE 07179]|uniref:Uncharacterized protein n=1 Tax=Hyella patelloides LEGE 07179 TaxID=945734 RepID=A0A563VTN5_9CYAN|nr:hypothetical protein [Hyella patelloides]VEP14842.1 hypothetical protein H1P_2910003 [Hyella patelloides LEGE 07179]
MNHLDRSIENNPIQYASRISQDLGIEKLQHSISYLYRINRLDDINFLTALFIEQLANSLELISKPAKIQSDRLFPLTEFPPLPVDFPQSLEMPLYLYGDKVLHESMEDFAIIIGRFCAFDCASNQWRWKYLILSRWTSFSKVAHAT